jgi:hypothetical protein
VGVAIEVVTLGRGAPAVTGNMKDALVRWVMPPIVAPDDMSTLVAPPLLRARAPAAQDAVGASGYSRGQPISSGMSVAVTGLPKVVLPQAYAHGATLKFCAQRERPRISPGPFALQRRRKLFAEMHVRDRPHAGLVCDDERYAVTDHPR